MRVLCTFPGRAGDILWALPTVRAISEHYGAPVDLLVAGEFASMIPLLEQQPYLDRVVADPVWDMSQGWEPPGRTDIISPYDVVYHLGYRGWPTQPLPYETYERVASGYTTSRDTLLDRPWITIPPKKGLARSVVCGWSDCHFELKVGLVDLCKRRFKPDWGQGSGMSDTWHVIIPSHSRWATETADQERPGEDWVKAAQWIDNCRVFLGDCSALHVLAVALGKPVVIYEPMEARWNPIFYPLSTEDRVRLVRGNDGLPTTDSRHTAEVLREVLSHAR